jgi:glucose-6-phosphate 1-dehydrogenase
MGRVAAQSLIARFEEKLKYNRLLFILLFMDQPDQLDEILICRLDAARSAVEPCSIVIFGASGDLTARKLVPAFFHLHGQKQMPKPFRIIGVARRPKTNEEWRAELKEGVENFSRTKSVNAEEWEAFAKNVVYCQGDFSDPEAYERLKSILASSGHESLRNNLLFYLAVLPSQFAEIVEHLHKAGLLQKEDQQKHWQRIVVEKPFGHDLASAQQLNAELTRYAHEKQIYRIDHYLGKETVQNILIFRFSNAIFEQLWNRQSVDHIQITVSEKLGVGSRGGYYEESGALRDMVQNHLLQVLALVGMEPPVSLDAEAVRDEKVKLLRSIRPILPVQVPNQVVRGQYREGQVNGELRVAYHREAKVAPNSNVETYVALKLYIDNWRWSGVPFYLRTGKNLPSSASEVRVQFRPTPHVLFAAQCGPKLDADAITLRLQPNEGISLRFNGKIPGASMQLRPVRMHFSYDSEFGAYTPEAYERLLLEAMEGDATLFIRRDEVEAAWTFVDPIRAAWEKTPLTEQEFYPAGSWGPEAADALLDRAGHAWRHPQPMHPSSSASGRH